MILDWNGLQPYYNLDFGQVYVLQAYGGITPFYPFEMILTVTKNITLALCE